MNKVAFVAGRLAQHDAEMHSIDGLPPEEEDFYEALAEVAVLACTAYDLGILD